MCRLSFVSFQYCRKSPTSEWISLRVGPIRGDSPQKAADTMNCLTGQKGSAVDAAGGRQGRDHTQRRARDEERRKGDNYTSYIVVGTRWNLSRDRVKDRSFHLGKCEYHAAFHKIRDKFAGIF